MSLQGSVMLFLLLYPLNLFSPIDSQILDFEFFSENHNFILIKQIIVSYIPKLDFITLTNNSTTKI
jgi:hypothetical protein